MAATLEQFEAVIAKIKTGVDDLKAQIKGGGLTAENEEIVLAKLTAIGEAFDAPAVETPVDPEAEVDPNIDQVN